PQKIRFAAVRFVLPRDPIITQRRELRDRPLLLIRLLLLAVFVLVLARPVVSSEAAVAVLAEPHDAVILLDGSASMELRIDDRSERERALERLDTLLDALPPGTRVGLVISDPRAPTIELGERDEAVPRIRAALDAWIDDADEGPRPGAWSLAEALPRASAMLSDADARPRVIYAIGDATDRGLGSLPQVTESAITVVPVPTRGAPDEPADPPPEHVGLRALSWEPAPELAHSAVRVRALVRRYGPFTSEGTDEGTPDPDAATLEVGAALEIDNREVARTRVELASNGEATAEFTHALGEGEQAVRATVRLLEREQDPLPVDDRRHLWLAPSEAVEVLIVNGDPSETRANDEIFFLSTAIGASDLSDTIKLRGLALDQLEDRLRADDDAALDGVDVLVLANVRAVSAELAPLLIERVDAGMGLWITVGDRVSASEYNARFAELLPLLLREAVYAGTAPGRTEARSEGIAPVQRAHPMFAATNTADGDLDLGATRTRRMFLLEPDPRRGADTAVNFTSGAPALVTRAHGRGRVALLTTTIDRDWGDLPLRPGFVPLAVDTLAWLAGALGHDDADTIEVGASKTLARATAYAVTTPSGESLPITPGRDDEPARFDQTDIPGHYRARPSDDAAAEPERFVVEFDAREADTTPVDVFASQLDGEGGTVEIYEPRWRELALLLLLLLGIESAARLWLGSRPAK
ncbi:MAG: VWA domain-containing protein, partial [Actinomycetota bacterium]|nr:VWA domain-containing protein [Actinomycetota bacterium]